MQGFISPFSPEMLAQIQSGFERYDSLQKKDGFIKLASLGWYVNGDMTLAHSAWLMDMAIEGRTDVINKDLITHYCEEIKDRAKFLEKDKSKRSPIIKEGINCHFDGRYYASVTLFLSQADGLSRGLLFKTRNKKRELKELVAERSENKFFGDILDAILKVNTIDEYFSEDTNGPYNLNRHAVLHGYDINFGTELNSLKAFSLLLFVNDFLNT
nr:hypothetical protein [uncultured Allomuricauda sp.]